MVNILTLNGGGYITIRRLITSIRLHVKAPYRHIILVQGDQQSQDQLLKEKDPKLHIIFSKTNLPLSVGYNHLIEYSMALPDTNWHMFLDDDFILKSDAIAKLVAFTNVCGADVSAMEHSWYGRTLKSPFIQECGGGTVMFSKEVFQRVGYIDEGIAHSEWDADWLRRITLCEGLRLAIAPRSRQWATHHCQIGQRRHGMKRFRQLQRISLDYMKAKWGVMGIAGNGLTGVIKRDVLDYIKLQHPLKRQNPLRGSGLILKINSKMFKL